MFQRGDEAEGSRLKWGSTAHDEHGLYPAHEPHPGLYPSYVPVNFSTTESNTLVWWSVEEVRVPCEVGMVLCWYGSAWIYGGSHTQIG